MCLCIINFQVIYIIKSRIIKKNRGRGSKIVQELRKHIRAGGYSIHLVKNFYKQSMEKN